MPNYEHLSEHPVSTKKFLQRTLYHLALSIALLAVVFTIGVVGLKFTTGFPWRHAVMDSALLMTGIDAGHCREIQAHAGILFASFYAILCKFGIVAALALPALPVVHRAFHNTFHHRSTAGQDT